MAPVPMSKVFFANSGSEANDTAIKLVWYYHNAHRQAAEEEDHLAPARLSRRDDRRGEPDRPAGQPPRFRPADRQRPPHRLPAPLRASREPGESEEAFATRLADNLEALILRGRPRHRRRVHRRAGDGRGRRASMPPATYFEKIQAVLRKYDILFIADEVICGFGRTGNMWGSQTFGLKPDMMTMAKALSSAYLPISGLMINEQIYAALVSREREDRHVRPRLHLLRPSGRRGGGARDAEDLRGARHRRPCAPGRDRASRRASSSSPSHPLVGEARGVGLIGAIAAREVESSRSSSSIPRQPVGPFMAKRARGARPDLPRPARRPRRAAARRSSSPRRRSTRCSALRLALDDTLGDGARQGARTGRLARRDDISRAGSSFGARIGRCLPGTAGVPHARRPFFCCHGRSPSRRAGHFANRHISRSPRSALRRSARRASDRRVRPAQPQGCGPRQGAGSGRRARCRRHPVLGRSHVAGVRPRPSRIIQSRSGGAPRRGAAWRPAAGQLPGDFRRRRGRRLRRRAAGRMDRGRDAARIQARHGHQHRRADRAVRLPRAGL